MDRRTWPLVGRDLEMHAVRATVNNGEGLFFAGGAGVGKTRLLDEAAELFSAAGVNTVKIAGAQTSAAVPLAPLLDLIDPEAEGDPARLILAELRRRSRTRPLALLIDDIHHLDEAAAGLIHQIAGADKITVVATYRTGEPMIAAVESLWKDGLANRLDVAPLDRATQDEMVIAVLGPTSQDTLGWLWDVARGHPMYARELVVDAAQQGRITVDDEVSRIEPPREFPGRLADLVASRIERLGPIEREIVDLLAVGGAIDLSVIAGIVGIGTEAIVKSALVRVDGDTASVAHPLIIDAARNAIGPRRFAELSRRLADGLEAGSPSPNNLAEAVRIRLDAGLSCPPDQLRTATRQALDRRMPTLALTFASALVAAEPSALAATYLAMAHALQRSADEADRWFERGLVYAVSEEERHATYLEWLHAAFEYHEDTDVAVALADRVINETTGPPHERARVLKLRLQLLSAPLDDELTDELGAIGSSAADPRTRALAALDAAVAAWLTLRLQECASTLAALQPRDFGAPRSLDWARVVHLKGATAAWTSPASSVLPRLQSRARNAYESGEADAATLWCSAGIFAALPLQDEVAATELINWIQELLVPAPPNRHLTVYRAMGEFADTLSARWGPDPAELVHKFERSSEHERVGGGALARLAIARAYRAAAQEEVAEQWRAAALEHAQWRRDRFSAVFVHREQYLYGEAATAYTTAEMDTIARVANAELMDIYAAEAHGHLNQDGSMLEGVAERAERHGAPGIALDALAAAATCYRSAGQPRHAFRCQIAAEAARATRPNQRSSPYDRMQPVLSGREQEVAALASQGETNRQIAAELYLSPRTVERHLERIYRRLGIKSRVELAALFDGNSPDRPS